MTCSNSNHNVREQRRHNYNSRSHEILHYATVRRGIHNRNWIDDGSWSSSGRLQDILSYNWIHRVFFSSCSYSTQQETLSHSAVFKIPPFRFYYWFCNLRMINWTMMMMLPPLSSLH